jgi:hypothetical protein
MECDVMIALILKKPLPEIVQAQARKVAHAGVGCTSDEAQCLLGTVPDLMFIDCLEYALVLFP